MHLTYYDETTKNAVIAETERICNAIGESPEVKYRGEDKIVTFNANIYINNDNKECMNKYREYLVENGYEKRDDRRWGKNKYEINEYYNEEHTIINLRYRSDNGSHVGIVVALVVLLCNVLGSKPNLLICL